MQEVKLFSLSKYENKSKYEDLTKNSSNFNNNSIKNVEIKKETHKLSPNSEIKTELATTMPTHNFIENSLVILTKQTLDIFLRQENPSELIALYTFYYYTAKWQQTNQIKCTSSYVAKALHWKVHKVLRVKKQLIEFGLIEEIRRVDPETKRVVGFYIKMNYIFKKETLETQQIQEKNQYAQIDNLDRVKNNKKPLCPKPQCGNGHTNALSDKYKNALSTNNNKYICAKDCVSVPIEQKNKKCANNKCANAQPLIENKNTEPLSASKNIALRKSKPKLAPKVLEEEFDTVWDLYPKKKDKTRAFKAFSKARIEGVPLEKIREGVQKYVQEIENTGIAHQYIKYGSTWFNNRCWEDEYDTNTKSSYDLNEYVKAMDTFENKTEDDEEFVDEKELEEERRKDLLFEGYEEIAPGVFYDKIFQRTEFLNEESRIAYEKNSGDSP